MNGEVYDGAIIIGNEQYTTAGKTMLEILPIRGSCSPWLGRTKVATSPESA